MIRKILILVTVFAVLFVLVWATDTVTLQGERTIYTAKCVQGSWAGDRCTGKLVAADRYRYRVLKARSEVVFWVALSAEPSGKFTDCVIQDGRNWRCQPNADAARSITLAMSKGFPVVDTTATTRPFHAVSKLTWTLLDIGIAITDSAMSPIHAGVTPAASSPAPRPAP